MNWLVINLKTYEESTGKNAVKLAKEAGNARNIILAVQPTDIYRVKQESPLMIFAQHIDPAEPGRNTGFILPDAVKEAGASGTLLNHAEHRLSMEQIEKAVAGCREHGLKTIVCAPDLGQARGLIPLEPDFIAYEDPGLIGTGKSVSSLRPGLVREFAQSLGGSGIIPLCGAGISTREDVEAALELGMRGVLVASAIVKAKDRRGIIKEFLDALA